MKLFEVIQPLFENKVEHIAKNQAVKIIYTSFAFDHKYILISDAHGGEYLPSHDSPQKFLDMILDYHLREYESGAYGSINRFVLLSLGPNTVRDVEVEPASSEEEAKQNLMAALEEVATLIVQFMADHISKKYLQWVVNRYVRHDFILNEDYQMVRESLEIYDQMKLEIGVPLTNKVSTADLFDLTQPYRNAMDEETTKVKEKELLARGEIEIPFSQGPHELVIIPKTFEASRYLSEPNGWCTKHEEHFKSYTKGGQVLYYFRHQGKPHLVSFGRDEFMKKGNRPFDKKEMRESSPAFQWIIEQKKKEVENMTTGDPSRAAYGMVDNGHTKDTEWAMNVIENDKTGNPSGVAYWMVDDGYAEPEWAMNVIENDKTGNPSGYAYLMVDNGYASQEWYDKHFKWESE